MQLLKTRNYLQENVRNAVAVLLEERLADAADLSMQAKQAHWNVKGPDFIALHKLFDKVNKEARKWTDLIAERVVQLGGIAEGTVQATAKKTHLPHYPVDILDQKEHLVSLCKSMALFGELIQKAIAQATESNDPTTADIFVEISRSLDMHLWFVESHLYKGENKTEKV